MDVDVKERIKYEIDTNEDGLVMACFAETRMLVKDKAGNLIGEQRKREVIDLEYLKKWVPEMKYAPTPQPEPIKESL